MATIRNRNSGELATKDPLYGERVEINAFEASDIDRPNIRIGSRASERLNSADGAEIIHGCLRIPFVGGQILKRRMQSEIFRIDAKIQGAAPSAHGAIAHADMIQISVNLESNSAAMARTLVSGFHNRFSWPFKLPPGLSRRQMIE